VKGELIRMCPPILNTTADCSLYFTLSTWAKLDAPLHGKLLKRSSLDLMWTP